ncbi:MAG: glycosyltransferase family 4 protein [Elusimicrobiota bacterium]
MSQARRIALDVSAALDGASGLGFYVERLTAAMAAVAPEREFVLTSAFWRGPGNMETVPLPIGPNITRLRLSAPQRLLLPAEEAAGLLWRERKLIAAGVDALHGLCNNLAPLSRLPGVVTIHHVGGELPPGLWPKFFFGVIPRRSALRADRVIAVSEHTRTQAISSWGLDPKRIKTVLEGGPDPIFRTATKSNDGSKPYVLHVGALYVRKNVPALLRAFSAVVAKDPARPLRLVLAGRPGDAADEINRLAATPPLAGRVEILGSVSRERLVSLYQGAAAVVIPSLLEGFGFPVLEAMACGAPVIAAEATSLPEVAGGAALLCDASAPEGIAAALARVLDEPDLAADLRRRGLARAASFSWETAARLTLQVIDEATADRRKS